MEILFVIIKEKYFDQILSGEKKLEYRTLSKFWISRLWNEDKQAIKRYDQVLFQCGYTKNARRMLVQCKGVTIDIVPEFDPHENIFVIHLGKIIQRPKTIPYKLHAV